MSVFTMTLPGCAATPSGTGGDIFREVYVDSRVEFTGGFDQRTYFHFPFTIPLFFGVGPPGTAARIQASEVYVNFYILTTVSVSAVRVSRISVFDGTNQIFRTPTSFLDLPEMAGVPPGAGGLMEGPDRFAFDTVVGRNRHSFGPVFVSHNLSVAARVDFGADGGVIGFTGASIKLQN